jgi:conjugal transfer pilus assembly protein TrbC
MIRIFSLIVMCLLSSIVVAEDDATSFIADAKRNEASQLRDYTQFAIEAKQHEGSVTAPYKQEAILANLQTQSAITDNQKKTPSNQEKQKNPTAIIFVSFSMPDESIVTYLRDAKKIHASVVIRGLINNSFKETFLKMSSIVQQAGGGGVELNPPLFKKFTISRVPAVVIVPDNQILSSKKSSSTEADFDVVYGDIPLFNALKIIRDHGSVSQKKADDLFYIMKDSLHE